MVIYAGSIIYIRVAADQSHLARPMCFNQITMADNTLTGSQSNWEPIYWPCRFAQLISEGQATKPVRLT